VSASQKNLLLLNRKRSVTNFNTHYAFFRVEQDADRENLINSHFDPKIANFEAKIEFLGDISKIMIISDLGLTYSNIKLDFTSN